MARTRRRHRTLKPAYTLAEMLVVLLIMTVVLAGMFTWSTKAFYAYRIERANYTIERALEEGLDRIAYDAQSAERIAVPIGYTQHGVGAEALTFLRHRSNGYLMSVTYAVRMHQPDLQTQDYGVKNVYGLYRSLSQQTQGGQPVVGYLNAPFARTDEPAGLKIFFYSKDGSPCTAEEAVSIEIVLSSVKMEGQNVVKSRRVTLKGI